MPIYTKPPKTMYHIAFNVWKLVKQPEDKPDEWMDLCNSGFKV